MSDLINPANHAVSVTPSDSTSLLLNGKEQMAPKGLYVGTGGNLAVQFGNAASITFSNVLGGTLLPIRPHKVMSTSTTASNIVALY